MKIEFENDKEKECLKHILFDWFMHNGDSDVLGCEPACRDESSPGCDWCINSVLDMWLNKYSELKFWTFGGEDWIMQQSIDKFLEQRGKNDFNSKTGTRT